VLGLKVVLKILAFLRSLCRIAIRNPKDLSHVFGVANSVAKDTENPLADTRSFPHIDFSDIAERSIRFSFQTFPGIGASISLIDAAALSALINKINAKRIFEFGTYKGVSTTQLALNLSQDGMVFSLDLPEDHPAYSLDIPKVAEQQIAAENGKGVLIPLDLGGKVTFLRADSAKFNTTHYRGSMDLIFVDGAHSYEYVKNDTVKGLEMLRPGGIIAWHDCTPSHPDVVRYLRTLPHMPTVVNESTIAFLIKGF
jgi:predicted O-methyltransferase YrrM